MKKLSIIILLAVAVLSGCKKDDDYQRILTVKAYDTNSNTKYSFYVKDQTGAKILEKSNQNSDATYSKNVNKGDVLEIVGSFTGQGTIVFEVDRSFLRSTNTSITETLTVK